MATKKKVKPAAIDTAEPVTKINESNNANVCEFIGSLIKLNNPKNVLEIGVSEGATTKEILKALSPEAVYIGIYVKDSRDLELKELMNEDQFKLIDSISFLKAQQKETFDFVFVDGDTNWAYMFQEFKLIEHSIAKDAIIIYYNTKHFDGPRKLVQYAAHYKYRAVTLNTFDLKGLSILHK
jgi:predicted O-methyltransferase YrrM